MAKLSSRIVASVALVLAVVPVARAAPPADLDAVDGASENTDAREVRDPRILRLGKPKWIKHTIIPGERLDQIAIRYDVREASLIRWNSLDPKRPKLVAGHELAIYTKHIPPPQDEVVYTVVYGDTWQKIADAHGVDADLLRVRWNPKVPRKFKAGQKVVIWVDPMASAAPSVASNASGSDGTEGVDAVTGDVGGSVDESVDDAIASVPTRTLPLVSIRSGSVSVGTPHGGKLVNSVPLPENRKVYTVRKPEEAYGSSHTLTNLQLGIATWRVNSGYAGTLSIGAISKKGGGKLNPHASHRSGRDVDIRLPVERKDGSSTNVDDVDWDALWSLIVALIDTGEVQLIYLTTDRQAHLAKAAKRAGASKATIDRVLQYPEHGGRNNGIVRHQKGHTAHMHVRFSCAPNETRCEND